MKYFINEGSTVQSINFMELLKNEYYCQLASLSPDEVYEGLLAHGLFSENLPPVFTSEFFYEKVVSAGLSFPSSPSDYISYRTVKNTGKLRILGIPTPFSYQKLCLEIKDSWFSLLQLFRENTTGNKHKVSRIHIRKLAGSKSLFEMNYKKFALDGNPSFDLAIESRFRVEADISSCFPSIYTHAIPWACVGRELAKETQQDDSKYYNRIDESTRKTTRSETHGILVGPHASNLLSEIILTKIDKNLCSKGWKYIRHIDDYEAYVNSQERAEAFLIDLTHELEYFGLLLNKSKCSITALPIPLGENWIRELSCYPFPDMFCSDNETCQKCKFKPSLGFHQVNHFVDYVVELVRNNSDNTAVFKYAIKMLSKKSLWTTTGIAYARRLIGLCKSYPYLTPLLDEFVFTPFVSHASSVSQQINDLFDWAILARNYESASHLLHLATKRNIRLDNFDVDPAAQSDCIFLTLSFIYARKNKLSHIKQLLQEHAKKLISAKDHEAYWIFVYSVLSQEDLKGLGDWSRIKKLGISFIRPEYR